MGYWIAFDFSDTEKMTEYIDKSIVLEIKEEWVELFSKIGLPII